MALPLFPGLLDAFNLAGLAFLALILLKKSIIYT